MNDIMSKLTGFLGPAGSSALGHALLGLAILIIGLFIVKLIIGVVKRLLTKVSVLHRTNDDGSVTDLVTPIASLIKALLTIFVLIAVLQHFGLTDVLEPLKVLVNKIMAAIPNIIGAGVIGYAGWIIAKIVSQLVGVALVKVDEQLAERLGNKDISVAKFGSALIFAIILLPIAVSALGVLNIPAISDPASAMIQKLMDAVPNIIGAGIILLVVFFVAKFVIFILSSLLEGANINALPQKMGIQGMFTESFTPTRLIGAAIMFFSMVAAATAAVNVLGIDIISEVFARVLEFGGGILVGGVILIIGNFLSTIAYNKLSGHGSSGVANIARIAILGLVLAMGLKAMGLADNIVTMAFGFTIGSVAVASALAFGLGGKDAAKAIADGWAQKINAR
ncbi:MAG: mechanosensitive ion channel [Gammaproteobacteria bacterium]|nr:mechanosensitive ion channel [Gammaproteobacteria bacterium]NNC56508.1 mechanosensitive ion channel [Woeseiaceae bacterium]NNL51733.1 mechanosensitive ion channel [Woeseiaceae bacterium]